MSTDTPSTGLSKDVREAAERIKDRRDDDDPIALLAEEVLQSDSENREANS